MILNEEVIKLALKYFEDEWCGEGAHGWVKYSATPKKLIEFAQDIYEMGYNKGYDTSTADAENL